MTAGLRSLLRRALVVASFVLATSNAYAADLPVLFVHGFCSAADTWDDTLLQLSTSRYGSYAPRVYEGPDGKPMARTTVWPGSKTFRIDFSDLNGGFDLLAIAKVPTTRKAGELKVIIDAIKQVTGSPKVILVTHSLGGLAARAYIQGIGVDRAGRTIPYSNDVAGLINIDTPNQGSALAFVSGFPKRDACILAETTNLQELQPASSFLRELNGKPWPTGTPVHSIVSSTAGTNNDGAVTTTSQDLGALPQFERVSDVVRWLQTFDSRGVLHLYVSGEPATVSLFTGIISDIDKKR